MGNNLTTFSFGENQVRTVMIDGEPWFVAKDICDVLEVSNVSQALTRLDQDDVTLISNDSINSASTNPKINAVNESGMYSLVLGSRKPEAKAFKKWVTSEVLPAIRKTGTYSVQPAPTQSPVFLTMPPVEEATRAASVISEYLRLEGTSRIAVLSSALKLKAPEYLVLIPAYATNAPRTMSGKLLGGEGNSLPAFAATSLLKKFNSGMSTVIFNKLVEEYGYIETRERPSSKHENVAKTYKAITTKGLEFGYNLSNEFSKGSVNPVWFESTFEDLLDIIS